MPVMHNILVKCFCELGKQIVHQVKYDYGETGFM